MKVTRRKDRTISIIGVNGPDLSSLLTQASLYRFSDMDRAHKKTAEDRVRAEKNEYGLGEIILSNIAEEHRWYRAIRRLQHDIENGMRDVRYRQPFQDDVHEATVPNPKTCGICGFYLDEDGICYREKEPEL